MSEILRICAACKANCEPGIDPAVGAEDPQKSIPFYIARDRCIFNPAELAVSRQQREVLAVEIAESASYTEAEGGYELDADPDIALAGARLGVLCSEQFILGRCGLSREEYEKSNEATLLGTNSSDAIDK
jgi:hypothetical protein